MESSFLVPDCVPPRAISRLRRDQRTGGAERRGKEDGEGKETSGEGRKRRVGIRRRRREVWVKFERVWRGRETKGRLEEGKGTIGLRLRAREGRVTRGRSTRRGIVYTGTL